MKRNLVTLASLTGAALLSASTFVMADHPMTAVSEKEFDRMYMEMDTNKDGKVSRAEYAHYHGTRFDTWDTTRTGMTRDQIKAKMFERELKKTDGSPQPNNPAPMKK